MKTLLILKFPSYFSISCSLKDHSLLSCSSIIFFLFSRFSVSFKVGRVASLQTGHKHSMSSSRKYPYSAPPPPPPGNPSLASYFPSKILAFKTPLPLGISGDLPWGGYQDFLCNCTFILKKEFFWQFLSFYFATGCVENKSKIGKNKLTKSV